MADDQEEGIPKKVLADMLKKASKRGYKSRDRLPERIFALGVEVGYHGHMEGVGWVLSKREDILKKGEKFGMKKLLDYYYQQGREFGHERRMNDLVAGRMKGSDEDGEGPVEDINREEFEIEDAASLTDSPRLQEMVQVLSVLPGITMPKLFKEPKLLK